MALETYQDLQTAILSWLARPGDPLVSPAVPDLIRLFERGATRRLKVGPAEKRTTLTIQPGAPSVQLPDDFAELRLASTGGITLTYVTPVQLPSLSGLPALYTIVGNSLYLGPSPSSDGTIDIIYQSGVPPLSDAVPTNWLLMQHPDCYLFGSLVEAEVFIGHDERIPLWATRLQAVFESIEQADRKARWGGYPLQIRAEGFAAGGGTASGWSSTVPVVGPPGPPGSPGPEGPPGPPGPADTSVWNGILIPYYLPLTTSPYTDTNAQTLLKLMRANHEVPVMVVLNPNNGPGTFSVDYAAFISLLTAAGGKVLGYVATGFGLRAEADVKADIDLWQSLYIGTPVHGIFLDEMPWDTGPGNVGSDYVDLYKRYTDYCHLAGLEITVGNPGTNQQPAWFSTYTADVIVVHEDASWPSEASMEGNFVGGHVDYPHTRRAALVYAQPTLNTSLLATLGKNVQWLYVTNDNLTAGVLNPWDTLPTYLDALFAALAPVPYAPSVTSVTAGTGLTGGGTGPAVTVALTTPVTPATGGTGLGTYAQGDILYANSPTALARLAKSGTSPRYLGNLGAGNNPTWEQVNLALGVTGVLPVANGGTGTATAPPYSIGFSFVGGVLTASQLIGLHKFSRAVNFAASFAGSAAGATANATASTVISIDKALAASPNTFSQIGTLTFAAGGVAATFAGSAVACAVGDVLRLVGPASADTTLANVYATLVGS